MSLLQAAARTLLRRAPQCTPLLARLDAPLQSCTAAGLQGQTPRTGFGGAASAAAPDAERHGGQCGARGFAAQTAADKYEIFAPEAGLTNIEGYTDDGFIVNDVTLRGGLLALRNGFYSWAPDSLDFSAITLLNPLPEVLVFGSGAAIRPLPPALVQQLEAQGIGLEVSNTVNAIATFNILAQEGRHVAGAFVPVSPGS